MTDACLPIDALLVRSERLATGVDELAASLREVLAGDTLGYPIDYQFGRLAWAAEPRLACIYLTLPRRIAVPADRIAKLRAAVGAGASVSRLVLMQDLAGASDGDAAVFHYTVEMTPEIGFEIELQQWYDTEHLPGLAAVPGCVRAQRWWNLDAGPKSLACYDLVDEQTLGSPPWLAVRHTAWSTAIRPRFTQTRRTMFELRP